MPERRPFKDNSGFSKSDENSHPNEAIKIMDQRVSEKTRPSFQVPPNDDSDDDLDVYKQEFDEAYSQSNESERSEPQLSEVYEKPKPQIQQVSKGVQPSIQKYNYLIALVNQLKILKEIELKYVSDKFAIMENKIINNFLILEAQNDKTYKESQEHKSVIESANVTKEILMKSASNIQQIRNERFGNN